MQDPTIGTVADLVRQAVKHNFIGKWHSPVFPFPNLVILRVHFLSPVGIQDMTGIGSRESIPCGPYKVIPKRKGSRPKAAIEIFSFVEGG